MSDKVISLFGKKNKEVSEVVVDAQPVPIISFEEIIKANAAKAAKLKEERSKANTKVIRNERLK